MSDLVGNLEDRFSRVVAHLYSYISGETKSRATIHLSGNNMVTGAFTAGGEEYYMEVCYNAQNLVAVK